MASFISSELSEDRIYQVRALLEACDLLEQFGLDTDDIETVEDAQICLLKKLANQPGAKKWTPEMVPSVVSDVIKQDRARREELVEFYRRTIRYTDSLHRSAREQLEANFPGFHAQLHEKMGKLMDDSCHIVVAGETSAGKSSLLNLILGEDLLPHSFLSSTSVICELKYGEREKVLAYKWDVSEPEEEVLSSDKGTRLQQLAKYAHQQEGRDTEVHPYNRIELFLGIPLLKGGITIVDTPGVGENKRLSDMVKAYLPTAFGFIYVINSGNAGGVQGDRSAIFVCNKWDLVPRAEADEVWTDTTKKLQDNWAKLDRSQVFRFSVQQASTAWNKAGYMTGDFAELLNGLNRLLPISLRSKVELSYRWLSGILQRSTFHLRVMLGNIIDNELPAIEEKERAIRERLTKLRKVAASKESAMRRHLEEKTDQAVEDLRAYLVSDEVYEWLMIWDEDELPDDVNWSVLEYKMKKKIEDRIKQLVSSWDQEQDSFNMLQSEMLAKFKTDFSIVEDDILQIERSMATPLYTGQQQARMSGYWDTEEDVQYGMFTIPDLTTGQKWALGAAAPVVIPLGVIVGMLALPATGLMAIAQKMTDNSRLQRYRADRKAYMTTLAHEMLQSFATRENVHDIVKGKVESVFQYVSQLFNMIPILIESDERLIKEVYAIAKEEKLDVVMQHHKPSLATCEELSGELDCYYLTSVRDYDISFDELLEREHIAGGSSGDVYRAEWEGRPVALKLIRNSLYSTNASEVMQEERILRKLDHENLVRFYGTSYWAHHEKVIFVMELCQDNLKEFLINKPKRNPGRQGKNPSARQAAFACVHPLTLQLASALCYIHSKDFVHRDLKLENILITDDRIIKLADVGLTKKADDVTGTLCGTPPYIAPEVLQEKRYGKPSDMYSFGILLWEMWYGEETTHAAHFTLHRIGEFADELVRGHRPDPEKDYPAPGGWREVMTSCWDTDPAKRPTAEQCEKSLRAMPALVLLIISVNVLERYRCEPSTNERDEVWGIYFRLAAVLTFDAMTSRTALPFPESCPQARAIHILRYNMGSKRVAIIGAGVSGLTSIKACLEEGLQPVCFEQHDDLGGVWYYSDDVRPNQGAAMYRSLITNSSKEMMSFSDFPFPKDTPPYLPYHRVYTYLQDYAQHFDLKKHIRFGTQVSRIQKTEDFDETGRWEVRTVQTGHGDGEQKEIFDAVMVRLRTY
ncbi:hypothetical protein Bbelb_390260 [Branchiostoma belcheri]|nr:hypothetical protein Bbelb_390260 [Branchiostoma belcheri]